MGRLIRRDFIFPQDFNNYVLDIRVAGCPLDFRLRCHGKVKIRNYSKKTKIKNLQIVEELDGWAINRKVVTLNLPFCQPISRLNFFRGIKRGLKAGQFQEQFALSYQLTQDYGWKTKTKKQWKFMV